MDANCKAVVLTDHILDHLSKIDSKQDKIFDGIRTQGETLIRNTVSLEEHMRRTDLIEKHLQKQSEEVGEIKEQVNSVEKIQTQILFIYNIFKPTKAKIKILALLVGLIGGGYQVSTSSFSSILLQKIEKIIE